MDRNSAEVNWKEEQWSLVQKTITDEATRARVAASFLPLFGPIEPNTVGVPNLHLSYQRDPNGAPGTAGERQRLWVDSEPSTILTTISVTVALHSHEVADPELSAALGMFRRAANVIARVEDALVFHGQMEKGQAPSGGIGNLPGVFNVSGGCAQPGLLGALTRVPSASGDGENRGWGEGIVSGVVQAINQLEAHGHVGPYACVLGHELFGAACTPSMGLVLPRDRILPFLDGPLVRSSALPADHGLVIALGGNPIELVVGSDISVRFLQMTAEPRYLFRVSERLALRAKEWSAVAVMDPKAKRVQVPEEPWAIPPPPARVLALKAAV